MTLSVSKFSRVGMISKLQKLFLLDCTYQSFYWEIIFCFDLDKRNRIKNADRGKVHLTENSQHILWHTILMDL